jgi:uncharacterized protein
VLVGLCGCATHHDRIAPVREAFFAGDLARAKEQLHAKKDLRLRNEDVKQLDEAMIELASGRPREAEQILRQVRDRFDHLQQASLAEGAASLLTDDNTRAYAGEDYERVMIRAMLAISNMLGDGGDAEAYALQVTEEQNKIIERAKERHKEDPDSVLAYKQVAVGPYIRAMIKEQSPLTLDEAAGARLQVANFAPDFADAGTDLERARHEVPIPPGHGVLYMFALMGRGPVKEQTAEIATQASLLIADRIISAVSPRGLPPTLAPVWVPKVRTHVCIPDFVEVTVVGQSPRRTTTLMDIGDMAQKQADAEFPQVIARAVARRVVKKGVVYAAKEATDATQGGLPSLLLSAVGVAWEATESADTRCWSLLPDKIQVLRMELPAGEHSVIVQAARHRGAIGGAKTQRVTIHEGRNTVMLGMFPESQLVGELVVGGEAVSHESQMTNDE